MHRNYRSDDNIKNVKRDLNIQWNPGEGCQYIWRTSHISNKKGVMDENVGPAAIRKELYQMENYSNRKFQGVIGYETKIGNVIANWLSVCKTNKIWS